MLLEGRRLLAERIPDTLQALIAARIDRLPAEEKRAAPARRGDRPHLLGGRRRAPRARARRSSRCSTTCCCATSSSREQRSSISGERAYRFKHVLIREVAYGGLSKAARAELHERFADWLHERAGEELLEIRAYHLDHAAQLLERARRRRPGGARRREAAAALEEAGRRALAREANRSRGKLLLRAGRARADARAPLPRGPRRVAAERPAGGLGRDGARARRRRARPATRGSRARR